ncbi:MAG: proline dehydrogenase family protein, partial [Bacteroidota bacterium]
MSAPDAVTPPQLALPNFDDTQIAFQAKTDRELKETYRLFQLMNQKALVDIGSHLGKMAIKLRLPFVSTVIKQTIFKQFCGGVHLTDCQEVIDHLARYNALTILDYGAEAKSEETDLNAAQDELSRAIQFAASNSSVPVVVSKLTALVDNDLLKKRQTGETFTPKEEKQYARFKQRIDVACHEASELGVGVFIDAEESWIQESMDEVVTELMSKYNHDKVIVYNTYQLYRHDKLDQLRADFWKAQEGGYKLGAKLVRGAYMDKERARAEALGYPSPIQATKEDTDRDFDEAVRFCLDHYETISMCNASHNLESVRMMAREIDRLAIPRDHDHLNFSQLQGMSDHLT